MSHHPNIDRREFIKAATTLIGGLIGITIGLPSIVYLLYPSLREVEGNSIIDLGPLEDYPIDTPTRFEFTKTAINGWETTATNYGLYVVRKNDLEARVFSDICTHLGCRVTWHADQQHYISPCHAGHFDVLGNVVSGPPPRPLDEFVTRVENGNLFTALPPMKREG